MVWALKIRAIHFYLVYFIILTSAIMSGYMYSVLDRLGYGLTTAILVAVLALYPLIYVYLIAQALSYKSSLRSYFLILCGLILIGIPTNYLLQYQGLSIPKSLELLLTLLILYLLLIFLRRSSLVMLSKNLFNFQSKNAVYGVLIILFFLLLTFYWVNKRVLKSASEPDVSIS